MSEYRGLYECRYLYNGGRGRPLVLLHGYSFTIDVWRKVGLIDRLIEESIPFLALDMPYGRVSSCRDKFSSSDANTDYVRRMLQDKFYEEVPIILGASLGGYNALRYGMKYDVLGLILIAPVWSTREDIIETYVEKGTPILLIYGDRDEIVSLDEMKEFVDKVPSAKLKIYENARHPAYLDKPDEFISDVLNFYRKVTVG